MALKTFTGTVVFLNTKEVQGRNGPITAYSCKVAKANGEEYKEWVSLGFKRPAFKQGDEVVIACKEENGFWRAVDVEVTKEATADEAGDQEPAERVSGASGSKASGASSGRAASSSSSKMTPADWDLKDRKIQYQSSRNAAIELVNLLLTHKAAPLTATAGKAGDAKRFEEVTALVDKLTVKFQHDTETFRLLNDIEDAYEAPQAEAAFGETEPEPSDDE
jgi:hypothetical protein